MYPGLYPIYASRSASPANVTFDFCFVSGAGALYTWAEHSGHLDLDSPEVYIYFSASAPANPCATADFSVGAVYNVGRCCGRGGPCCFTLTKSNVKCTMRQVLATPRGAPLAKKIPDQIRKGELLHLDCSNTTHVPASGHCAPGSSGPTKVTLLGRHYSLLRVLRGACDSCATLRSRQTI